MPRGSTGEKRLRLRELRPPVRAFLATVIGLLASPQTPFSLLLCRSLSVFCIFVSLPFSGSVSPRISNRTDAPDLVRERKHSRQGLRDTHRYSIRSPQTRDRPTTKQHAEQLLHEPEHGKLPLPEGKYISRQYRANIHSFLSPSSFL